MSKLSHREFKELDKLYKKSGFTKLSQQEQRRLERLEALSQDNKKGVEKEKCCKINSESQIINYIK